jgi:hypothetical protein
MLTITLLATATAAAVLAVVVLCVVATRESYQPATVGFASGVVSTDLAADTVTGERSEGTLAGDWKMVEVNSLAVAEQMLDQLEVCRVNTTELEIAGNDKFIVRWR